MRRSDREKSVAWPRAPLPTWPGSCPASMLRRRASDAQTPSSRRIQLLTTPVTRPHTPVGRVSETVSSGSPEPPFAPVRSTVLSASAGCASSCAVARRRMSFASAQFRSIARAFSAVHAARTKSPSDSAARARSRIGATAFSRCFASRSRSVSAAARASSSWIRASTSLWWLLAGSEIGRCRHERTCLLELPTSSSAARPLRAAAQPSAARAFASACRFTSAAARPAILRASG